MERERWLKIERLYHDARERPAGERAQFLAQAKTAYRDSLALWKDADPDIPILKEAKEEFAKLE